MSRAGPLFANQRHHTLYIDISEDSQRSYRSGDRVDGTVRVEPSVQPAYVSILSKGLPILYDSNGNGIQLEFFWYSRKLHVFTGAGENFAILQRGTADDGRVELPFDFTFPQDVRLAPPSV